jgi:hypothetical protein
MHDGSQTEDIAADDEDVTWLDPIVLLVSYHLLEEL